MNQTVKNFLAQHGFYLDLDLNALTKDILSDMDKGLSGKKSYQDMIPTYFDPSEIKIHEKSVIVIDAGGTNFRSSLVTFKKNGKAVFSDFEKTKMPGTERELSKKDFFAQIAKNIRRFRDKCSEICFCFSYAMTITENHDGILTNFSKEVKAPEVVGCTIGEELKKALKDDGWQNEVKIFLLNDTVSALLAGAGKGNYSSYIGFILGTGMNCAYVQPKNSAYNLKRQIVVCESAKFGGFKNSDFDIIMDEKSVKPGSSPLEKLCSGAYIGPLALETLYFAAKEGLLSQEFSKSISNKKSLSLIEVSSFLENSDNKKGIYSEMFDSEKATKEDCKILFQIFDALVERMAKLAAAVINAALIQCGESSKEKPICIACNGSSFFKTYKVLKRTKSYLKKLTKGSSIYYKILSNEVDITLGTAKAAFI
ncbi:hexokinase [Treponema sp. UBA3813]|uniref:hexokinase n=1 Tax=Treponema sp. UBA3813 TaxID=1947715 RepID=UPI0025F1D3F2|nr:hexokinase [Treponema sp. UBA3813]